MKNKILVLIFCMIFLSGTVIAADYKFQNKTGADLLVIHDSGNLTVTENVTASWFMGIFNWIIGATSTNYLTFNGTTLDFSESYLNTTIGLIGNSTYLLKTGDTATGNYTFDTDTFFIDSSSNRVGIGTSSPDFPLHVNHTDDKLQRWTSSERNLDLSWDAAGNDWEFTTTTSTDIFWNIAANSGFGIGIAPIAPTAKLHVDGTVSGTTAIFNGGNVGIGTTSPSYRLEVASTENAVNLSDILFVNGTSGRVGIGTSSPSVPLEVSIGASNIGVQVTSTDAGAYYYAKDNDATEFYWGANAGTFKLLDATNNAPLITVEPGANGNQLYLKSNGNVGIGTASPGQALTIGNGGIEIIRSSSPFILFDKGGTDVGQVRANTVTTIAITNAAGNTEYLTVNTTSGNIGIGTTSPSYRLEVASTENAVNLSNILFVNGTSGNVGIGTTTASEKLVVDGNIKLGSSDQILFGDSSEVSVQHDGTDFLITMPNAGDFVVNAWFDILFTNSASSNRKLLLEAGAPITKKAQIQASAGQYSSYELLDRSSGSGVTKWVIKGDWQASDLFTIGGSTSGNTPYLSIEHSSGNVGIGTTSPADELTVVGTLNVTNIQLAVNCADGQVLKWSGGVGTCGTDDDAGNSNIFNQVLNTTSNVIFNRLNLTGGWGNVTITESQISDFQSYILTSNEANLNVNRSGWWDNLNTPADINAADITDDGTYLLATGDTATGNYTFDTDTFFIDSSSGRIGIGTASPAEELDVVGTIQVSGDIRGPSGWSVRHSSSPGGHLLISDSPEFSFRTNGATSIDDSSGTEIFTEIIPEINQSGTAAYTAFLVNPTETSIGSGSKFLADFQVNGSSKVVIGSSGNVGIGTTSPTEKLHIANGGKIAISDLENNRTTTLEHLDDGNFQISTDVGGIEIAPSGTLKFRFGASSDAVVYDDVDVNFGSDSDFSIVYVSASDRLDIFDKGAGTGITVNNQGRIGINTTTPQNTLNVLGDANITGNVYRNNELLIDWAQATNGTLADNSSIADYIDSQDTNFNTTLAAYVDSQDTTFNTSLKNYADATFITQSNEANLNVNSSDWWDNLNTPADINAADITDDNTYVRVIGDTMTGALSIITASDSPLAFTATDDAWQYIQFSNSTTRNAWVGFTADRSDFTLTIENGADIVLTGGNVGIGTASPSSELEVSGDIELTNLLDNDASNFFDGGASSSETVTGISSTGALSTTAIAITGSQVSDDGTYLLATGDTATGNYTFDTDTFFIDSSSGRVGIGTSSPEVDLHLESVGASLPSIKLTTLGSGNDTLIARTGASFTGGTKNGLGIKAATGTELWLGNSATPSIAIDTSGNVGIGTTSPGTKLEISEGVTNVSTRVNDDSILFTRSSDGGAVAGLDFDQVNKLNIESNGGGSVVTFEVGNSERVRIDGDTGNVGIGTSSPVNILHVEKDGTYTSASTTQTGAQQIIKAASNNVRLYLGIDNVSKFAYIQASEPGSDNRHLILQPNGGNGNVGIGTTSPSDTLTVVGTLNATNIQLASNCADGQILKWSGGVGTCGTDDSGSFNSFFIDTDETTSTEITDGETILFSDSTGMTVTRASNTITFSTTLGTAIEKGEIANSGTLSFDWVDDEIADTLTIGSSSTVAGDAITDGTIDQSEIQDDILDFVDFADDLDLDATTNIDFGSGSNSFILDLETGTGDFIIQDAGTMFAQFYDTGDIQLGNNNELYVDTSTGRVGINTTSPDSLLSVYSSAVASQGSGPFKTGRNSNEAFEFAVGDAHGILTYFQDADSNGDHDFIFDINTSSTATDHEYHFDIKGSRIMTIEESGEVGIGTTSPSSELEVSGDIELTNLLDNDASNFFDGGCSADQHVTSISSTGAITCGADSGHTASMSFTLAGTSGSSQTITQGNTLLIEAGTGITTTGAATDKVTVAATLGTAIEKGEIANSGTLSFDWVDGEIADTLTINTNPLWDPDGDGGVFNYDDANPIYNGKAFGAIIDIRGDATIDSALIRVGASHGNHYQASNGFYIGSPETNGTVVINSAGDITAFGGDLSMTPDGPDAQIADTFAGNTFKNYISFAAGSGSNDPGAILHETSGTETNEGVLHLMPSDDNSFGDYVSIHGTNDPDVLKLHTDGSIEGITSIDSFFSGGASASQTVTGITDLGVLSTTSIAITGSQVSDDGTFVLVAGDTMTGTLTSSVATNSSRLAWTGGALRKTTNQGGFAMYADSSVLFHAGDNGVGLLSDLGISDGSTFETLFITADGVVEIITNRQTSYAASFTSTFDASGGLTVPGALTAATINTGSGAKELGDAAVANGDTNSIPTGDQVYDFVIGQGYTTNTGTVTSVATGTGIGGGTITTSGTLTVAGGTCLTADADGLSVTGNCIADAQILQDSIDATEIAADAITNSELAANSVDLTSDALSTAYAGNGLGGGGTAALFVNAGTDIDITSDAVTLETTLDSVNSILGLQQIRYETGDRFILQFWNDADTGIRQDDTNNQFDWYLNGVEKGSFDLDNGNLQIDGALNVDSTGIALDIEGDIAMSEDDWIGIGSTTERIEFNGGSGLLEILGANLDLNSNDILAVDKIDANTFDPVYTIDGIRYATYLPGMSGGVKEEVTGTVMLNSDYTMDFKNLEVGSDLWLFYQVTDFGSEMENLQIILTPSFNGNVWYDKNPAEKTLIIYGDSFGEVSYRLTANRFDWRKWDGNYYIGDGTAKGSVLEGK